MTRLQDLVHAQVDPLDDVPAIVEHPPDVLCVHGAGKVRVAVVRTVLLGVAAARLLRYLNTSTLTSMDLFTVVRSNSIDIHTLKIEIARDKW